MKQKILIVEDESIVAMEIASYIESLGYEAAGRVATAEDAYAKAIETQPDVILMDVHLKGEEDGISAAAKIRAQSKIAIVYITAFSDDSSIERAVATDPSAYLTKPFNRQELAAALKIATKYGQSNRSDDIDSRMIGIDHEFSYDPVNRELLCCGIFVHLTRKELDLLALLMEANGQLVSIYTVENVIWPDKFPNENTRRGLVARLRTKLKHQFVQTIPGQGYRLILNSSF